MLGNLPHIANGWFEAARRREKNSLLGVGTTMEGIWQNYPVYDFTYRVVWGKEKPKVEEYFESYASQRYPVPYASVTRKESDEIEERMRNAWKSLGRTLYSSEVVATPKGPIVRRPRFNPLGATHISRLSYLAKAHPRWPRSSMDPRGMQSFASEKPVSVEEMMQEVFGDKTWVYDPIQGKLYAFYWFFYSSFLSYFSY